MRPISGSSSPARARAVRFMAYALSGSRDVAAAAFAAAGVGVVRVLAAEPPAADDGGTLLMPWVMYSSTSSRVTPWAASSCAAYGLGSAEAWPRGRRPDCTSCLPALCTCSTAVCSTRRKASVCSGSFCCPREYCSIWSFRYLSRSRLSCGRSAPHARGSARRPDRAPARRAGAPASGGCACARSPRDTRRSRTTSNAGLNI